MNEITENRKIVIGRKAYVDNLLREGCLVAKLLYSSVANGFVTSVDAVKAKALPGVVEVVTCFDIPDRHFSIMGVGGAQSSVAKHPNSTLLAKRVRCYADPIVAVVAVDSLVASQALQLIKVEYSTHSNVIAYGEDKSISGRDIHDDAVGNLYASYETGFIEQGLDDQKSYSGSFMINPTYAGSAGGCFCYTENDSLIIHTSANSNAVRKTVGDALDIPISSINVLGFSGGSHDVVYEPLCAYLCTMLAGRPVRLDPPAGICRLRAPMQFEFKTTVSDTGSFLGRTVHIDANVGAYASDVHDAAESATRLMRHLYSAQGSYYAKVNSYYTNIPATKACEGFGAAHSLFAIESHIDDIAVDLGVDPMLLRIKNCIRAGYGDSIDGYNATSYALDRCIIRGRELTDWDNKRKTIKQQNSDNRKGIGMAILCYNANSYTKTTNVRLTIHGDGSLTIALANRPKSAATIACYLENVAKCVGIATNKIRFDYPGDLLDSTNEIAVEFALNEAAQRMKARLIDHARIHLGCDVVGPDIKDGFLVDTQNEHRLLPIFDIVEDIVEKGQSPIVEACSNIADKTLSFGVCFAEVTVNIPMCKVSVDRIITVLDNGNVTQQEAAIGEAKLAIADAISFTLNDPVAVDTETAMLSIPGNNKNVVEKDNITIEFVPGSEPTTAFGKKSIGDAPFIAVAPAIRNAVLNATGIKIDSLPITSERLFEEFEQAGMI